MHTHTRTCIHSTWTDWCGVGDFNRHRIVTVFVSVCSHWLSVKTCATEKVFGRKDVTVK